MPIHLVPPKGWMNDPNGLIFYQGYYHVFYQYHPDDVVWGPMHWGHATTQDFILWETHPIALYPDEKGTIFSGCAVVDSNNCSGLGTTENPPLLAFFTYHDAEKEKTEGINFQKQGVAYSLDVGRSWQKYEGNPVLTDAKSTDFRDPKVFWDVQRAYWVLCLAEGDCIGFYQSDNLLDWRLVSHFGKTQGAHGGVWECPDLFPMDTPSGDTLWILLVSINPGGPHGGSATQYFIGHWNGEQFSPIDDQIRWLDQGTDNYAGVSFSNHEQQRLLLAWMNNWHYGDKIPETGSRGSMTAIRELFLNDYQSQLILGNRLPDFFVKHFTEVSLIHTTHAALPELPLLLDVDFNALFQLDFLTETNEKLSIVYKQQTLSIDRSHSLLPPFHSDFFQNINSPFVSTTGKMKILLHTHSIEVFTPEGISWTLLYYFQSKITGLQQKGLDQISIRTKICSQ